MLSFGYDVVHFGIWWYITKDEVHGVIKRGQAKEKVYRRK